MPQVIIDAFTLLEGSLFVIDINGQLVEHARSERLWINHGLPSNDVPLSFARGVVLRDKHPTRVGKYQKLKKLKNVVKFVFTILVL